MTRDAVGYILVGLMVLNLLATVKSCQIQQTTQASVFATEEKAARAAGNTDAIVKAMRRAR